MSLFIQLMPEIKKIVRICAVEVWNMIITRKRQKFPRMFDEDKLLFLSLFTKLSLNDVSKKEREQKTT